jgi:hypothetical protein
MNNYIDKKGALPEVDPEPVSSLMVVCAVIGAAAGLGNFLLSIKREIDNAPSRALSPKQVRNLRLLLLKLIKAARDLESILSTWESVWKPTIIPATQLEHNIKITDLKSGASVFFMTPHNAKLHKQILRDVIHHLNIIYDAQEKIGKMNLVFIGDAWQLHPLDYHQEIAMMIARINSNDDLDDIKDKLLSRMKEYYLRSNELLSSLDVHYPQF